ncbi:MAG TPA: hypothetical protein EYH05_06040 [Anaerolineae bacterium]|nr:hypothetical protein [Anaerolineae bacterium]
MQAYTYKLTIEKKGTLTLKDLPMDAGEKVEVIVIPRPNRQPDKKRYPFWGKPINYLNPTEPVAEADWEVLQ